MLSHGIVNNGRVLQGGAHVALAPVSPAGRREWRHYLRRPGVVEVIGRAAPPDLMDGYLADCVPPRGPDLSSISDRVIDQVQGSSRLDHATALRAPTTVVRWAASLNPGTRPAVGITRSDTATLHILRLSCTPRDLPLLIRFCEEFALHEWLQTVVQDIVVPRAETDLARGRDPLDGPLFALNELVPLWMPPTHLGPEMKALWDGVESRTRYSLMFERQITRIRDLRDQVRIRPPRRF